MVIIWKATQKGLGRMFVNSNYLYIGSHALLFRPLKKQTFFLVFNMLETYHFVSVKAGFH